MTRSYLSRSLEATLRRTAFACVMLASRTDAASPPNIDRFVKLAAQRVETVAASGEFDDRFLATSRQAHRILSATLNTLSNGSKLDSHESWRVEIDPPKNGPFGVFANWRVVVVNNRNVLQTLEADTSELTRFPSLGAAGGWLEWAPNQSVLPFVRALDLDSDGVAELVVGVEARLDRERYLGTPPSFVRASVFSRATALGRFEQVQGLTVERIETPRGKRPTLIHRGRFFAFVDPRDDCAGRWGPVLVRGPEKRATIRRESGTVTSVSLERDTADAGRRCDCRKSPSFGSSISLEQGSSNLACAIDSGCSRDDIERTYLTPLAQVYSCADLSSLEAWLK